MPRSGGGTWTEGGRAHLHMQLLEPCQILACPASPPALCPPSRRDGKVGESSTVRGPGPPSACCLAPACLWCRDMGHGTWPYLPLSCLLLTPAPPPSCHLGRLETRKARRPENEYGENALGKPAGLLHAHDLILEPYPLSLDSSGPGRHACAPSSPREALVTHHHITAAPPRYRCIPHTAVKMAVGKTHEGKMAPVHFFSHGSTMMLGEDTASARYWERMGDEALRHGVEHVVIMVSLCTT